MKKLLLSLVIILIFFIIGVGFFFFQISRPISVSGEYEILPGEGVNQISASLAEGEFIDSSFFFEVYVWLTGREGDFIATKYDLPAGASVRELVGILTTPRKAPEITLQFIEGWTAQNISDYLLEQGIIDSSDDFLQLLTVDQWWDSYPWLRDLPADTPLEGFLFPDTYNFYADAKPPAIIAKMLDNFDRKFGQEWRAAGPANDGPSLYDVVRLASILEKEVKRQKDMKMVADIFWKRLKIGMPLQADSTLNYVIKSKQTSLTAKQLKIDSPYNSYKYKGLPPTPISNPGLGALLAAWQPTVNDYYYFLTAPDGNVYYGRTLEEHSVNRNYLD